MAYAARQFEVSSLNAHKEHVVHGFLNGKDVFVSLPTEFGRSLCF